MTINIVIGNTSMSSVGKLQSFVCLSRWCI